MCNRATWGWARLGATVGANVRIGYARVSTKDHAHGLQIDALLAAGGQAGRVAATGRLRTEGDEPPAWDNQKAGSPVRYIISRNVRNRGELGVASAERSEASLQPALNLKGQDND